MDTGIIFVGGGVTVSEMTAVARNADARGFSTLAMAEAWRSGWVTLTAMAAATQRVRLAPYVLNAYGRSPYLAGMAAVDFNEFSGGRLMLGVGGGNRIINEQWQGIPHERVLTRMREYVELMKIIGRTRLGETVSYSGKIYNMEWTPSVDPGDRPYPVYLAAVFPRMMRVAAQVADGIAGGATLSATYVDEMIKPQARAAAAEVDRDFTSLKWNAVAITAVDEDRERARRAAREAICHLYAPLPHPYYEFTMREQGFSKSADDLLKLMPAGKLEAAVDAIPDECIDQLAIAGTVADCRRRLAEYEGTLDEIMLLNAMPPEPGALEASYAGLLKLLD
ncbi:MAG: LLM class flavin-dependent oxidoreductase [Gammaproteobacteria bacterium]